MMPMPKVEEQASSGDTLVRVHKPTREEFQREFVEKRRPAIITGMMEDWKALRRWTPEFFQERFKDLRVQVNMQDPKDDIILGKIGDFTQMSFAELVERVQNPSDKIHYLRAYPVYKLLDVAPELVEDYEVPVLCPNWLDPRETVKPPPGLGGKLSHSLANSILQTRTRALEKRRTQNEHPRIHLSKALEEVLFFGGAGTITPLHSDGMMTGAYLAQVLGRKRCVFISPEQDDTVYPRPFRNQFGMAQVDFRKPDLERFPRFRQARLIEGILNPGEIMYAPHGWWHALVSLDVSISYSIQLINESNVGAWLRCMPERMIAQAYYAAFHGGFYNVIGAKEWA